MKISPLIVIAFVLSGSVQAADIDPFNGLPLALEQTRVTVELTKAQNSLLEEQTKKAKAEFMLQNADKIFAAELKKQLGQSGGAGMGGRQGYAADYPADRFPEPAVKAKKLAKTKKSAQIVASLPPVAAYVPPSGPQLIGILRRGDSRVAMIESRGEIIYAKVGDQVAGLGRVDQIADRSALIGGAIIAVAQVPVANVDKQDIRTLAGAGGLGGTGGTPPSSMQSGFPGIPAASFPMTR